MRASILAIVGVASLGLVLSVPAYSQDLQVGNWSGTMMGVGQNRNSRPASLEVKLIPDPHWLWRGGPRDMRSVVLVTAQGSYDVGTASLDTDTLSFTFTERLHEDRVRCELKKQTDGSYEGGCSGGNFNQRLILRPPDAPPGA